MSNHFQFVETDPSTKLKPGKSLIVRKHVMKGKNARPNSRRAQREARRKTKQNNELGQDLAVYTQIPPALDDFTIIRFARPGISTEDQNLIVDAFTSDVVNQALSPLEKCVDFDKLELVCFEWVSTDATFLHLILAATHAIRDIRSPDWNNKGRHGKQFTYHMKETLSLLSKRISTTDVTRDELMLYIVIQLSLLAAVADDWNAAAVHLAGLSRIVQLRGGWSFLRTRPKLHFKLDRLDLAWSLSSGQKPYFLHPHVSWEPMTQEPSTHASFFEPRGDWHPYLRTVFKDFQCLAYTINVNTRKNKRYEAGCFQMVLSNLQSRLMYLESCTSSPQEELMRLSMLALLATSFKVPGRKIPYTWLHKALEDEYISAISTEVLADNKLRVWILLIATILAAPLKKSWIEEAWTKVMYQRRWRIVQDDLMDIIWIEDIHGRAGSVAFDQLLARSRNV